MVGPSKLLLSLEVIRALFEFGTGCLLSESLKYIVPHGDRHPVLIIPGLSGDDSSTYFLRKFFSDIGYTTYSWNLGRNLGPREGLNILLDNLADRIKFISEENGGQEISIVGWSLGGLYARELAKLYPDLVRQVITLGSPFKPTAGSTHASKLYELLSGDLTYKDPEIHKKISIPPPVPFTSIYSKTDGIVYWKCSIEDIGFQIENIEVHCASHLGLGYNPMTLLHIADRLIQSKNTWIPYIK